jgi:hypothetical protein
VDGAAGDDAVGPIPPRRAPSRAARGAPLVRLAAAHPGQAAAAAGALVYFLGYVNVRVAAAGLGVAPADLALTTNDYLVAAAGWLFLVIAFAGAYLWLVGLARDVGWRSLAGIITLASAAGVAVVVVLTVGTAATPRWAGVTAIVIAFVAGIGWWLGGPGLAVILGLAVAVVGLAPVGSHEWAKQLRHEPATAATAPLWLELILAVEEGTARFPTGADCVVRVSDRVFVGADDVRVEPAPVAFRPGECFPAP